MKMPLTKNDYFVSGTIILMIVIFIVLMLTIGYFASTHMIVKIIDSSNWQWIFVAHILALSAWSIAIIGVVYIAILDDFREPKPTLKRQILIPLRILALFLFGLFIFWILIIADVIPTSKDLISNQITTYDGCYQLRIHDPAKGPNEYYLITQNSSNVSQITISPDDYNALIDDQNCKQMIQIKYLPNSRIRLSWSFK